MRLTIGNKLAIGFTGVLLLMLTSSVIVYLSLDRMNESVEQMTSKNVPALRAADELMIELRRSTAAMRGYLLLGDEPAQATYFEAELNDAQVKIDAAVASLKEFFGEAVNSSDRDAFRLLAGRAREYQAAQREVMNAARDAGTGPDRDLANAKGLMESKSVPLGREIVAQAETLRESAAARVSAERDALDQARRGAITTLIVWTPGAVLLALILAFLLSRGITSALQGLLARVQQVAEGDLSGHRVERLGNDEIGDLARGFDQMVLSLRAILLDATSASNDVAAASSEISTGAQQQLTSLNETASSLNEITATAEEFKSTMQEFADRAKAVHEAAVETARRAGEGRTLTDDSAQRIDEVRQNALAAGESVLRLSEEMQRIGEITGAVNEIAEQTKLLALNASIEAARAGEDGRGFAVVAMQVRELANQSKESVARIEQLVSQTQRSLQAVVSKIADGGSLSDQATQTVRQVTESFGEITRAVEQIREAMSQISTGAREQEAGITELVGSISQIDSASKESVAAAEQTQSSIVAIDRRIQTLNASVARFKL